MKYFETFFMEDAKDFLTTLDPKIIKKIFYNLDIAEETNDPKLFKKIQNEIWEFRTRYLGIQVRFLAFWDKMDQRRTLVIVSNGFIKKKEKIPISEIEKAKELRTKYFSNKTN
jgi:phage-related protein